MKLFRKRRGGALVAALATLLVVMLVAGAVVRSRVSAHRQARQSRHALQAEWLAESAVERARAQLARASDYSGETWRPAMNYGGGAKQSGAVEIRVEPVKITSEARHIVATAAYPDDDWRRVTARREYTITISPSTATNGDREDNP